VLVVYRVGAVALISHISADGGYVYDGGARAVTPTGHFRTTVYMPGWIRVPLGTMYNSVFSLGPRTRSTVNPRTDRTAAVYR
jgi:hypothetical protein